MQDRNIAWKEAGWVFALSRALILVITVFSVAMFPPSGQVAPVHCSASFDPCLYAWYHLDAIAYVNIAHHGYTFNPDTAFFPFWPLLEHFGGLLLGGSFPKAYYLAGLLLANICFYFALVLLYRLLAQDFEASLARRALFFLAFYPYALFFFAGYTESLFLLLTLALFLVLRRGKAIDWWLAGLFGLVATATRSTGIILAIPFLVVYIQRFWTPAQRGSHSWGKKINALLPIALIPLGVVAYMVLLYVTKGNPLFFVTQESNYGWHRHLSFPWVGITSAIGELFRGGVSGAAHLQNAADLTFTLLPLTVVAIGWKRMPLHYALFALGVALFTLSFPQQIEPLTSQPRYMLILFPIMAMLALWSKRKRFYQWALVFVSLSLLTVNTVLFISHYWVA
jgi:Gpi18-like mannosyltransferase